MEVSPPDQPSRNDVAYQEQNGEEMPVAQATDTTASRGRDRSCSRVRLRVSAAGARRRAKSIAGQC